MVFQGLLAEVVAFEESLKKTKKKVGRRPTTWIKLINIQLNIESNPAEKILKVLDEIKENRKDWKRIDDNFRTKVTSLYKQCS